MKLFELGGKYYGRFISNYDRTVTVIVMKRTAKTIVVQELTGPGQNLGEKKRKKLRQAPDYEYFRLGPGVTITAKSKAA